MLPGPLAERQSHTPLLASRSAYHLGRSIETSPRPYPALDEAHFPGPQPWKFGCRFTVLVWKVKGLYVNTRKALVPAAAGVVKCEGVLEVKRPQATTFEGDDA